MTYYIKDTALDNIKNGIDAETAGLHPLDRAQVLREVQGHACHEAMKQEATNTEVGIPERPADPSELDDDGDFV